MIVRFCTAENGRPAASVFMAVRDDTTKRFATGSAGYNANGKVMIDGKLYQVSCNLVLIGSKDASNVALEQPELRPGETRTASGAILGGDGDDAHDAQ